MSDVKTFLVEKEYKQMLTKFKDEFDKNWLEDSPSTSDRLNEFTFMKILGQGAFG